MAPREQMQNRSYYDLRETLLLRKEHEPPVCPICKLVERAVLSYLDSLLYELVLDPETRHVVRASRGFCNAHAWMLPELHSALGAAILHEDIVNTSLRAMDRSGYHEGPRFCLNRLQEKVDVHRASAATASLVSELGAQEACPACRQQATMEDLYLSVLLEHLVEDDLAEKLRTTDGLCLPHFRRGLELVRDEATYRRLLEIEQAYLRGLQAELKEFIRKNDYRFQHEGFGVEGDSWLRAIARVVARRGLK